MMAFTILYVEDEDQNKALIREIFKASGYTLVEAYDGQSGYEAALSTHPDLILMDIGLPDMEGTEVVLKLKQTPAVAHIPVIALTADDSRENRERCSEVGCATTLFKPVSRFNLLETIRHYIDSGKMPEHPNHPQTDQLVSRKQVLIADDSDDLCAILSRAFNPKYFDVHVVGDGIRAINYLKKTTPAVVILDVIMPGLSGFDVLNHIRTEDGFEETKVILITGNEISSTDTQAERADLVLLKPIDLSALFAFAKQMMAPTAGSAA